MASTPCFQGEFSPFDMDIYLPLLRPMFLGESLYKGSWSFSSCNFAFPQNWSWNQSRDFYSFSNLAFHTTAFVEGKLVLSNHPTPYPFDQALMRLDALSSFEYNIWVFLYYSPQTIFEFQLPPSPKFTIRSLCRNSTDSHPSLQATVLLLSLLVILIVFIKDS